MSWVSLVESRRKYTDEIRQTQNTDLLWEQFFAQRVQSDELSGQQARFKEALSNQHNFTDQFEVGHNHSTRPGRQKHIKYMGMHNGR